jgi:hypothetical protein
MTLGKREITGTWKRKKQITLCRRSYGAVVRQTTWQRLRQRRRRRRWRRQRTHNNVVLRTFRKYYVATVTIKLHCHNYSSDIFIEDIM